MVKKKTTRKKVASRTTKKKLVKKKTVHKKKAVKKRPAKKRIVNKTPRSKSVAKPHSINYDINEEKRIGKEIDALERETLVDEKNTVQMAERIKVMDSEIKQELKNAGQEIKAAKITSTTSNKKLVFWILGVLALVIIGIVIANVVKANSTNDDDYNNFVFTQADDGIWTVSLKGIGDMPFYFHPKDLDGIYVDGRAVNAIGIMQERNGQISISLDPDINLPQQGLAAIEISKVTTQLLDVATRGALQKLDADETIEVLTCKDNLATRLIVEFHLSDRNEVLYKSGCVIVNAVSVEDLIKVADAYMYRALGVITI